MSDVSRRKFLQGSGALLASSLLPSGIQAALSIGPSGRTLSSVQHVVIFMQENRSFDHYYGTLQGVRGFADHTALLQSNGKPVFQQYCGNASWQPFHLDSEKKATECWGGLSHSWESGHAAWNGGKYNNWVAAKTAMTMGHFRRNDLPFHFALADAFTICDHYHSSVLSSTSPNRLYLMSGMIDPQGNDGGPAISNIQGFTWTTYPERLQNAGVSWKIYQVTNDNFSNNTLSWFKQYQAARKGNPLYDNGMQSVPRVTGDTVSDIVAAIRADALNNRLPQVSWVIAPGTACEHPSVKRSISNGADMINQVLLALTANPAVWASTVMFLNYDENDGFFDHMPPPSPPPGTADEFVNGLPIGLGARVPMTVVSPWSRGGFVCSEVFDHTSVLRFLERWTGVQEPNISAWRRNLCGDLTSAFDFSTASMDIPPLPNTTALKNAAVIACTSLPPPTAPASGAPASVQEAGTRPARPLAYEQNAQSLADESTGRLWITMNNSGERLVHHRIHPNGFRTDGPWHFDIPPGGSRSNDFNVQTYGGGNYDLSVYGPNGFLRRFRGNIHNTASKQLEASSRYTVYSNGKRQLQLVLSNTSAAARNFTVTANTYLTMQPLSFLVPARATKNVFISLDDSAGWYDISVTVTDDANFLRQLVGHLENGRPSVTG